MATNRIGTIFVGIDPGLHGAVAWMDGARKLVEVHDCPLDAAGEYDFRKMADLIRSTFEACTEIVQDALGLHAEFRPPIVTIEDVHSMPKDGKCSAFRFGFGYGAWRGVLGALGLTPNLVSPQSWKRTMLTGIANDKQAEARALKQRFQGHPICSQLHGPRGGLRDGRVDALLLAEHGRLNWKLTGKRAA